MSVNEKMTAIANEVRTISNTDEVMGLDKMAEYLNDANAEVNSQTDLIAQIQSALQGKAAGSGGGTIETVTGKITYLETPDSGTSVYYIDENGELASLTEKSGVINVMKGSILYVMAMSSVCNLTSGGATKISVGYGVSHVWHVTDSFEMLVS
jgi:uncharacterized phage infection (PIP) family protein YhgE